MLHPVVSGSRSTSTPFELSYWRDWSMPSRLHPCHAAGDRPKTQRGASNETPRQIVPVKLT